MLETLDNIKVNDIVKVISIKDECQVKRRLMDIGLIPGTYVTLLYKSVFNDPKAYLIRNTVISIRDNDAKDIEVIYE